MPEALKKADEVLQQSVQGITDLINVPALINLDFADVQTVMKDMGFAHIGIGYASGDDKALEAVKQAVTSPLLETTITGAANIIINISGNASLEDVNIAASYVREVAGEDANVIFGVMYEETQDDSISITVIATGMDDEELSKVSGIVFNTPASEKKSAALAKPVVSAPVSKAVETQKKIDSITTQKPVETSVPAQGIHIPGFLQRNDD